MMSPLPPRLRDSRNLADLIRQNKRNARQLGVGFAGGRFPLAHPLGATALYGDDEDDDGDAPLYLWKWSDRLVVTTPGAQTFRLSEEPVEESLTLRWHPDGRAPLTQVNERYILSGQVVTILDPDGDIEPGDVFSAQYQYDPDVEAVDGVMTLVGAGTVGDTITMPAGTQVGDFLVVALALGSNITDSRVGLIASHHTAFDTDSFVYAGTLSGVGPMAILGAGSGCWAVFHAPAASTISSVTGPGTSATLPQVAAKHAIFVGFADKAVTAASVDIPTGYTNAIEGNTGSSHFVQRICYWDDPDGVQSPAGSLTGSFDDYLGLVIGVTNFGADE